ncbi:MAG: murein transglycosylase domain-containing protein [Chitinivibrionales bacterium]|nr:murein transglycosylase domain-containing protein [Chitinivibrionales bacterium]
MKTLIINAVAIIGMSALAVCAQQNEFSDYKNHQAIQRERFAAQSQAEFDRWSKKNEDDFKTFKKAIIKEWGEYISSSNRQWVEFSGDTKSCSIVDFAKGTVTIEVLLPRIDTAQSIIKSKLAGAIVRVLTSKGTVAAIPIKTQRSSDFAFTKPILSNQVVDSAGSTVAPENINAFANRTVETGAITAAPMPENADEKYVLTFPLAPDHLARRMAPFLPLVKKYCVKYDLDQAQVLAIMHTESYFNPLARSNENAIGLMQLVPEKGAYEALKFINDSAAAIPRAEYLYDPETNIELGCAYLYLLKTRAFGEVANKECRMYCSIAGYNTGSLNVAYAFIGQRNLAPAIIAINSINNSGEVYDRLVHNLPFVETRYYLENVVKRVPLYQQPLSF